MPILAAMLDDTSDVVRDGATETLSTIGQPATGLALQLLHSQSSTVRSEALLILQRIVQPETFSEINAAIENLLDDPNSAVRTAALIASIQFGFVEESKLRALIETDYTAPAIMRSGKARNSRDVALEAIGWLGADAARFVPDLVTLLEQQPDFETKSSHPAAPPESRDLAPRVQTILRILTSLKTLGRPAAVPLLARLNGLTLPNRLNVIGTLLDIGVEPELVKPMLLVPLSGVDYQQASLAGHLLSRADPAEARRQVSLFVPRLENSQESRDFFALYALVGLGSNAHEALPLLISLLWARDPGDPSHRMYAVDDIARILGALGRDAALAVPALIAVLEDKHGNGRLHQYNSIAILRALGSIGPAAESSVPKLLAMLDDANQTVPAEKAAGEDIISTYRAGVMTALGKIAHDSPEVQLAIRRQMTGGSALCRAVAMHALAHPGHDSPQLLSEIVEIFRNDDVAYVRAYAAMAIAALPGNREPALASLTEALGDPDANVRKTAALALGSIGPAAKSALPAIRQALLDARCGIPSRTPPLPSGRYFLLSRDILEIPQLPLVQALLNSLRQIDVAE